jgi:cytoskeletal protein RodZ
MSLINDALKRARQSQQKNPPGGPPLFPVEIRTRGGIGWFLPTVIVALVVAAGIFIALAMTKRTPPPSATAPAISATQQIESVSVPPSNPPAAVSTTNEASTNESSISNSVPPPPPPPPEPKLQGIIYDPAKPWAIVSGKTVYVGDHVGDFRVKEITKNSVTLQNADGSEKTLVMGE